MIIVVENGHPMPKGQQLQESTLQKLRQTFSKMASGQSFVFHENKHVYLAAKQVGVKITVRKLETGGFRIWKR